MTTPKPNTQPVWQAIERDRQFDRTLRRICTTAWVITVLLALAYAVIVVLQLIHMAKLVGVGAASSLAMISAFTPLLIVLGLLSVLIATLTTIGTFVRSRTASLAEIQLRLAGLEELVAQRGDGG